jgi:hypothetical protein
MTALPAGTLISGPAGETERSSTTVARAIGTPARVATMPLGSIGDRGVVVAEDRVDVERSVDRPDAECQARVLQRVAGGVRDRDRDGSKQLDPLEGADERLDQVDAAELVRDDVEVAVVVLVGDIVTAVVARSGVGARARGRERPVDVGMGSSTRVAGLETPTSPE